MGDVPRGERQRKRWVSWLAWFGAAVLIGPGFPVIVEAAPRQEPPAPAADAQEPPPVVRSVDLPGAGSGDVLAYGEPTPDGFVIMAAAGGEAMQPIASLFVQGMESSMWSGWTCVTGSGRYLAAVFGPVEMLNSEPLRNAGAFLAVVDLVERSVVLAPERVAYKYHAPGCGPNDEVTALRHVGDEEVLGTEFLSVDPANGAVTRRVRVEGHLTSPAPVGETVFAASDLAAVAVSPDGAVAVVAEEPGQVVDLHGNAEGGLDYLVVNGDMVEARRALPSMEPERLGSAPLGRLRWAAGREGENRLVGEVAGPVTGVDVVEVVDQPTAVSLAGDVAVETTADIDPAAVGLEEQAVTDVDVVALEATNTATGASSDVVVSLEARDMVALDAVVAAEDNYTDPVCAVPRNDPAQQVMQPSPRQVEWAVHKAVRGELTTQRPLNWNGYGLPAYSPQGQFPRTGLGQAGRVPAQVLLGILAQESNLWQASRGALPSVPGNPLIGDYYGTVYNSDGRIIGMDYDDADCGYGVGQVTDHMTVSDTTTYTPNQKRMIALDYQANIAASLQILEEKWRTGKAKGTWVNNGDPSKVENWYFPIWAYNSGWKDPVVDGGCCLGWSNNPANSDWRFDRAYFQRASLDDARTPGDWAYQERVLGFAERGIFLYGERAFTPVEGWLNLPLVGGDIDSPIDRFVFCVPEVNWCSPTYYDPGPEPQRYDRSFCMLVTTRRCYWTGQKEISSHGVYTEENPEAYSSGGEPPIPAEDRIHPPACDRSASLPPPGGNRPGSTAQIVDDVPNMSLNLVGCAAAASAGTFTLDKGTLPESGQPLAEIDLHQIGAGYGGHFWYAHTNWETRDYMTVVGTWTPPATATGWRRIVAHIPDHGADTYQADYLIFTSGTSYQAWRNGANYPTREGADHHRVVNQRWNENRWIDLGIFQLGAGARVVLTNETYSDGDPESYDGRQIDIAWDAMAFIPASKPTVAYVSMGDSYSSGEGVEDYYNNSDVGRNTPGYLNACHRSAESAHPSLVFDRLAAATAGPTVFSFIACSGATTEHVLDHRRYGEVPQLAQGWLDENTTHVSISISGNDVEFDQVLHECLLPAQDCDAKVDEQLAKLPAIRSRLRSILSRIRTEAPNARIVLVGYPYIVVGPVNEEDGLSPSCINLTLGRREMLRREQNRLVLMMAEEADVAGVSFVDPRAAFAGHEACSAAHEWVNSVIFESDSGSGVKRPGVGSFHPKAIGQQNYAPLVFNAFQPGTK